MKRLLLMVLLLGFSSQLLAADKVATYFSTKWTSPEKVTESLKKQGFQILGQAPVNGLKSHQVLFVTTPALLTVANKPNRAFAAVQRILFNESKKEIKIANPHYFLQAFLQKDFDQKLADKISNQLKNVFKSWTASAESLKKNDLSGYHFMFGMPYYDEFERVAYKDHEKLMKMVNAIGSKVVFKKKLDEKKYLLAVSLSKEVESFVDKLKSRHNSILLPYTLLIDNDKAYILHPKYYLAISLPLLTMGEFMTISDIPSMINGEFEKFFK